MFNTIFVMFNTIFVIFKRWIPWGPRLWRVRKQVKQVKQYIVKHQNRVCDNDINKILFVFNIKNAKRFQNIIGFETLPEWIQKVPNGFQNIFGGFWDRRKDYFNYFLSKLEGLRDLDRGHCKRMAIVMCSTT